MRFVLTIVLVFTTLLSVGQDAYDRYTNFFSIEGSGGASFAGLGLMPTVSFYRSGHKIDVGLSVKVFDIWKDGPGILGSYLSYKYYPNLRKNDFNLYFGYHNLFTTHQKGKRFPVIRDDLSDMEFYPDMVYLLENLVGIGFDYQMGNKLYMFNDYSVGFALHWTTFHESETIMEVRSSGMIRLGIGYNLGSRKAK